MKFFQPLVAVVFCLQMAVGQSPEIIPEKGMTISKSCRIAPGEYRFDGAADLDKPVIFIRGNNLEIDFQNAVFIGSGDKKWPDEFTGLALKIEGKNIVVKGLTVNGFKVGLLAVNCSELQILNSDFSYNYRPKLKSTREKENLDDWLSYHQNDKNEWLRYGAGVYLDNCTNSIVKSVKINGCQNALLMTNSNGGLFMNNDFQFNSGIGIGLYRSSENSIFHNLLNWNVRGYSHKIYQRGQDSAGILVYEQSNKNTIAYNAATHCGDGLFLWAGQSTMDTGEGGCNDNVIYANDFSYAPTNGLELTFSRNEVLYNRADECTYGIWAGYSFDTKFVRNQLTNCRTGLAIEHGQNNIISRNYFENDSVGIRLWANKTEPSDWGYSKKRDTRSRGYEIEANSFSGTRNPLKINDSEAIDCYFSSHSFTGFQQILDVPTAADSAQIRFLKRPEGELPRFQIGQPDLRNIPPMPDGIDAKSEWLNRRGRHWIWMTEWGPHDFKGPICQLLKDDGAKLEFWLLAPSHGTWKVVQAKGFKTLTMNGGFPGKIQAERRADQTDVFIQLECVFDREQTDVFGKKIEPGVPFLMELRG